MKKAICALALLGAAATSQAGILVTQNFDNVSNLGAAGWVQTNNSSPLGSTAWFQGDQSQFAALNGSAESYIAANFNNAAAGGLIDNWLISPVFSTTMGATVNVWVRGAADPNYSDNLSFGFSDGSSNTINFAMTPSVTVNTDGWTMYSFNLAHQAVGATGRFAINYNGLADASNYVGIDALQISQIPEPASMLLLGTGLVGLFAARRRKNAA